MADTITTNIVRSGSRTYAVHLQNASDGTGESAVTKVDISGLVGPDGSAPTAITLLEVEYDIQGFSSVQLFWEHTVNDEMVTLGKGQNIKDWNALGGLHDPKSAGSTGDVLLTTVGASATATYDMTLVFKLED